MSTCNLCFSIFFAIWFSCVSHTYAEGLSPAFSPAQLGAIREAQIRVSENRDAVKDGNFTYTAADARVARIMARLNVGLPTSLNEATLMGINIPNVMPRMTIAERKESFFAGVNFLRLGLIAVFTILTMLLIGKHVLKVLRNFPKELWEISAYTGGIALLVAQGAGFMAINQFWAFFGCLLIGGVLASPSSFTWSFLKIDQLLKSTMYSISALPSC